MKKKILLVFLALSIGATLAFFTLFYLDDDSEKKDFSIKVLQTGVYSSYENAVEAKEKVENAIIYEDNGLFRVLVGASTTDAGLEKIETIMNKKGISYYKKDLIVKESDQDLFLKYNMMLEKANEEDAILLLNARILEKMVEV